MADPPQKPTRSLQLLHDPGEVTVEYIKENDFGPKRVKKYSTRCISKPKPNTGKGYYVTHKSENFVRQVVVAAKAAAHSDNKATAISSTTKAEESKETRDKVMDSVSSSESTPKTGQQVKSKIKLPVAAPARPSRLISPQPVAHHSKNVVADTISSLVNLFGERRKKQSGMNFPAASTASISSSHPLKTARSPAIKVAAKEERRPTVTAASASTAPAGVSPSAISKTRISRVGMASPEARLSTGISNKKSSTAAASQVPSIQAGSTPTQNIHGKLSEKLAIVITPMSECWRSQSEISPASSSPQPIVIKPLDDADGSLSENVELFEKTSEVENSTQVSDNRFTDSIRTRNSVDAMQEGNVDKSMADATAPDKSDGNEKTFQERRPLWPKKSDPTERKNSNNSQSVPTEVEPEIQQDQPTLGKTRASRSRKTAAVEFTTQPGDFVPDSDEGQSLGSKRRVNRPRRSIPADTIAETKDVGPNDKPDIEQSDRSKGRGRPKKISPVETTTQTEVESKVEQTEREGSGTRRSSRKRKPSLRALAADIDLGIHTASEKQDATEKEMAETPTRKRTRTREDSQRSIDIPKESKNFVRETHEEKDEKNTQRQEQPTRESRKDVKDIAPKVGEKTEAAASSTTPVTSNTSTRPRRTTRVSQGSVPVMPPQPSELGPQPEEKSKSLSKSPSRVKKPNSTSNFLHNLKSSLKSKETSKETIAVDKLKEIEEACESPKAGSAKRKCGRTPRRITLDLSSLEAPALHSTPKPAPTTRSRRSASRNASETVTDKHQDTSKVIGGYKNLLDCSNIETSLSEEGAQSENGIAKDKSATAESTQVESENSPEMFPTPGKGRRSRRSRRLSKSSDDTSSVGSITRSRRLSVSPAKEMEQVSAMNTEGGGEDIESIQSFDDMLDNMSVTSISSTDSIRFQTPNQRAPSRKRKRKGSSKGQPLAKSAGAKNVLPISSRTRSSPRVHPLLIDETQKSTGEASTEQPQSVARTEQLQTEASMEQPQTEASMKQPQTEASTEQPQSVASTEQLQAEASMEQLQTEASINQPQTEASTEQPQKEASMEQPQKEASMEQPQKEASMEQSQTEASTEENHKEECGEQSLKSVNAEHNKNEETLKEMIQCELCRGGIRPSYIDRHRAICAKKWTVTLESASVTVVSKPKNKLPSASTATVVDNTAPSTTTTAGTDLVQVVVTPDNKQDQHIVTESVSAETTDERPKTRCPMCGDSLNPSYILRHQKHCAKRKGIDLKSVLKDPCFEANTSNSANVSDPQILEDSANISVIAAEMPPSGEPQKNNPAECDMCGAFFMPSYIVRHKKKCREKRALGESSGVERGDALNTSSENLGPSVHLVPVKKERQPDKKVPCPMCGQLCGPFYLGRHKQKCRKQREALGLPLTPVSPLATQNNSGATRDTPVATLDTSLNDSGSSGMSLPPLDTTLDSASATLDTNASMQDTTAASMDTTSVTLDSTMDRLMDTAIPTQETTASTLDTTTATLDTTAATLDATGATLDTTSATLDSTTATLDTTGATLDNIVTALDTTAAILDTTPWLDVKEVTIDSTLDTSSTTIDMVGNDVAIPVTVVSEDGVSQNEAAVEEFPRFDNRIKCSMCGQFYKPSYIDRHRVKCARERRIVLPDRKTSKQKGKSSSDSPMQDSTEPVRGENRACRYCGNIKSIKSIKSHEIACRKRWDCSPIEIKPIEAATENQPVRKCEGRKAAKKAISNIQSFIKAQEKPERKQKKLRYSVPKGRTVTRYFVKKWPKELAEHGEIKCPFHISGCRFLATDEKEMSEHYLECEKGDSRKKVFRCIKCKYESPTERYAKHHARKHEWTDGESDSESDLSSVIDDEDDDPDVDFGQLNQADDDDEFLPAKQGQNANLVKRKRSICHIKKGDMRSQWGERLEMFQDAMNWALHFRQKNEQTTLGAMSAWQPKASQWNHLSSKEAEKYLPTSPMSPWFRYDSAKSTEDGQVNLLKRFESISNELTLMNVGGPIWSLDWLPTPIGEDCTQYLAVYCHRQHDQHYSSITASSGPAAIQIWSCQTMNVKQVPSPPKLELILTNNEGAAWCIKWCPRSSWPGVLTKDEGYLPWLGTLAVATASGKVVIYSVPHPDSVSQLTQGGDLPVYKVTPVIILELATPTIDVEEVDTCRCLDWQYLEGSSRVLAGYTGGQVALYDLLTTSQLLLTCTAPDKPNILRPLVSFLAHQCPVTSLAFCQRRPSFFATASQDRLMKVWNMEHLEYPVNVVAKSEYTKVLWPLHWAVIFAASDNVYSLEHNALVMVDTGYFGIQNRPLTVHNACIMDASYSDWLNTCLSVDSAGIVEAMYLPYLMLTHKHHKSFSSRRMLMYCTETEPLTPCTCGPAATLCPVSKVVPFCTTCLHPLPVTALPRPRRPSIGSGGSGDEDDGRQSPTLLSSVKKVMKTMEQDLSPPPPLTVTEMIQQYAVKYKDKSLSSLNTSKDFKLSTAKALPADVLMPPLAAHNKVEWNPNLGSHLWAAVGAESGLVRLVYLNAFDTPQSKKFVEKVFTEKAMQGAE